MPAEQLREKYGIAVERHVHKRRDARGGLEGEEEDVVVRADPGGAARDGARRARARPTRSATSRNGLSAGT